MCYNDFFSNIDIPVIVFEANDPHRVAYLNSRAALLLSPVSRGEMPAYPDKGTVLSDLFSLPQEDAREARRLLDESGSFSCFDTKLALCSGEKMFVSLSASKTRAEGHHHIIIYLYPSSIERTSGTQSNAQVLATALNIAYKSKTTDEAIDSILSFVGRLLGVSRAYIFESVSEALLSNTYEWCAPGVKPEPDRLEELSKDSYPYDAIVGKGINIADDIGALPEAERDLLEPRGAKSLARIPLMSQGVPLGYAGFDDCVNCRKWAQNEIQLLCYVADLLSSLIVRRSMERSLQYSLEVLNTVTEKADSLIYVNDIHSKELLFVSKSLARLLKVDHRTLMGKRCCEVFSLGDYDTCAECTAEKMTDADGNIITRRLEWERFCPSSEKWYLVRDAIINWLDGREVHIQTATDITKQKEYERQLEHYASTDMMTGVFNREWGRKLINEILEKRQQGNSTLAFIDLNDLKGVNDKYGHEVGDIMIIKTIEIVKSCTRQSDVLCRWGGDEFVMILRGDEQQIDFVMKKILSEMERFNDTGEQPFTLGFSYGLAEISSNIGSTAEEIVSFADKRMYRHKMSTRRISSGAEAPRDIPAEGSLAQAEASPLMIRSGGH